MMNEHIVKFLQKQDCATVCCVDAYARPYCFNCFYAFDAEEGLLIFKSGSDSHHSTVLKTNPIVAGTILPSKLNTLFLKGIQFVGVVFDGGDLEKATKRYYTKNPIALAMPGEIWILQIVEIKMTDNTQGFGKKMKWIRS